MCDIGEASLLLPLDEGTAANFTSDFLIKSLDPVSLPSFYNFAMLIPEAVGRF